ncbi:MAG TPA: GcrA family cell cycle regulator [Alphaproteobacteria bacterium]
MDWTSEQINQLTRLWHEGLSTAEIGKRLGISKNAVVGKAHRLRLAARPSPIKRVGSRQSPAPRPAAQHRPQSMAAPARTPSPAPQPAPRVVELSTQTCRWPIGHPGDPGFHFCTERAIQGKPYCIEHSAVAYVKKPKAGEAA